VPDEVNPNSDPPLLEYSAPEPSAPKRDLRGGLLACAFCAAAWAAFALQFWPMRWRSQGPRVALTSGNEWMVLLSFGPLATAARTLERGGLRWPALTAIALTAALWCIAFVWR
jgi:hypothetical protein